MLAPLEAAPAGRGDFRASTFCDRFKRSLRRLGAVVFPRKGGAFSPGAGSSTSSSTAMKRARRKPVPSILAVRPTSPHPV